jgi:hypothetical protein
MTPSNLRLMGDAIMSILNTAGTPGSNATVEYLASELVDIDLHRTGWSALSTTERWILRITWEYVHRKECPLSLNPED